MSIGEYLKSIFSLEGKTILISGATGGIGSAISRGLAAAGAETALCARNQQKCRELADEISAHGGAATAHALDLSDLDSIHRCVDEVMQRYGKIDVLFNVAGINRREGLLDVEPETYDRIMDTNLKGVFFLSQAVARARCTGADPAISSISALTTTPECWAAARSTAHRRAAWSR